MAVGDHRKMVNELVELIRRFDETRRQSQQLHERLSSDARSRKNAVRPERRGQPERRKQPR